MTLPHNLIQSFVQIFGVEPSYVVRSPGRVNLIGEHTDYNGGFVLPAAIDRNIWIAAKPQADGKITIHSSDFHQSSEFNLLELHQRESDSWSEYIKGIAWVLREAGHELQGWQGIMAGDIPVGAGLSSSAALEMAVARIFAEVSNITWEASYMAALCQRAENQWIGVNCGIMDQLICGAGIADHALFIDCRSLSYNAIPIPSDTAIAIMDTDTRRGLMQSAYNQRRMQCELAAKILGMDSLRDASLERLQQAQADLDIEVQARAKHVISENMRVIQAKQALEQGDAAACGALMNLSHRSLREDFQVSNPQLDAIVEIARHQSGCLGARMTGAGFGGCAVALIASHVAESFSGAVATMYQRLFTGLKPKIYICRASQGTELIYLSEM
jgi:galactokinase